eukprot:499193-Prorocentrum_minimum.AAC.4
MAGRVVMDDWLLWPHIVGEEDLTETESEGPDGAEGDKNMLTEEEEEDGTSLPSLVPQHSPHKKPLTDLYPQTKERNSSYGVSQVRIPGVDVVTQGLGVR